MNIGERDSRHGEKMIEIKVRFWTDNIAAKGKIIPKHCWNSGVIRIERNDLHGIKPPSPVPFNSLSEILPKIEKVLQRNKIQVHFG
jgi:hypothetical protein